MEIAKLKYYSTEKLEGILNELENGDGGRGMNDLMTIEYIKDLIDIREYNALLIMVKQFFNILLTTQRENKI